ncbi:hypothetical protein MMC28_007009 [Mycoblastus sanguinarius]|nr:hypothetical protein [Mycoblastus sanguinarius]
MMSTSAASLMLKVTMIKPDGSEVVLDVKQKADAQEILRVVKDEGFLVLKDVQNIEPFLPPIQDDIKHNMYLEAIIAGVEEGHFVGMNYKFHKVAVNQMSRGDIRPLLNLGKDPRLLEFSCHFLAGHRELKWIIEYDSGLREATGQMKKIEAFGRDIILCNNWLLRSTPRPIIRPGEKLNVALFMYV